MTALVYRSTKGSRLTSAEGDANMLELDTLTGQNATLTYVSGAITYNYSLTCSTGTYTIFEQGYIDPDYIEDYYDGNTRLIWTHFPSPSEVQAGVSYGVNGSLVGTMTGGGGGVGMMRRR